MDAIPRIASIVVVRLIHHESEQALLAAENRLKELTEHSRRCAKATATLWEYLSSPLQANSM